MGDRPVQCDNCGRVVGMAPDRQVNFTCHFCGNGHWKLFDRRAEPKAPTEDALVERMARDLWDWDTRQTCHGV